MTERERKQRRLARERRMGRYQKEQKGGMFAFRSYVTVVLAGAFLLLSFLQTETTMAVCERVKNTIAYQIPVEELTEAKTILQAFFNVQEDGEIPVILEDTTEDMPLSDPVENVEETKDVMMQYAPDIDASP